MKPERVVIIQAPASEPLSDKIPRIKISGKTLVRIIRSDSEACSLFADNPKQMLKILRAFESVVRLAIMDLEGKIDE